MAKVGKLGGLTFLLGGVILLPTACAGDERDFAPAAVGGSSAGGSPGGGATGGDGNLGGDSAMAGSNGTSGASACTDTLPSGDECGGDCEPCPDGLSCNENGDCTGQVCLSSGECCTPGDEADLCVGRCGMVTNCEEEVVCGDCVGEATCEANVCECPTRPCAITTQSYGDANEQTVRGLAVDSDGNAYLIGEFKGTLTFGDDVLTSDGTTWYDIYLAKFDATGTPVWAQSFGNSSDQQARGVTVDGAGNVIIIGRSSSGTVNFGGSDLITDSDMLIAKFSAEGAHQFSEAYGDDNVHPMAVACDPATAEIVVTGYFYGSLKFASLSTMSSDTSVGSYYDLFTVRFTPAGVPQASKDFGSGYDEMGESVAVAGSSAYVAGTFKDVLDFGSPNPTPLTSTGWSDLFVAKLGKSTFSHGWSKRFGDNGADDYAVDTPRLVVDPQTGDVVVGGNFEGTMEFSPELSTTGYEMFLARLDGDDGASVWAAQFANAELRAMALGADGYVYVTGNVSGDVDFGGGTITGVTTDDVFLAKFDLDGEHVYSRVFTSPTGSQYGMGVGATDLGEAWIAARFNGQLELGLDTLQTQGGYDVAVGKYAP